jgi:hypothetical protein
MPDLTCHASGGRTPLAQVRGSSACRGCRSGRAALAALCDDEAAAHGKHRESETAGGADAGVAPVKAAGSGDPDDLHRGLGGWRGCSHGGVEVELCQAPVGAMALSASASASVVLIGIGWLRGVIGGTSWVAGHPGVIGSGGTVPPAGRRAVGGGGASVGGGSRAAHRGALRVVVALPAGSRDRA